MVSKIAFLILSAAVAAAGLLVVRQQRLQAVHDMAQSVMRAHEDERALWRLRIEIANRITPGKVTELAQSLGPLTPIPLSWCIPMVPAGVAAPTGQPGGESPDNEQAPTAGEASTTGSHIRTAGAREGESSAGAMADDQWALRRTDIEPDEAPDGRSGR